MVEERSDEEIIFSGVLSNERMRYIKNKNQGGVQFITLSEALLWWHNKGELEITPNIGILQAVS